MNQEELGQAALDALSNIHDDMDNLSKAGDEWATEWLHQVWGELPVPLRQALGDQEAGA